MNIGEKIKQIRQENNLTQEEFAVALETGISKRTVSYWEKNKREIKASTLLIIAKKFGKEINFFMDVLPSESSQN